MIKEFTDDLIKLAQDLYKSGMRVEDIADQIGIGKHRIRSKLSKEGWKCELCGNISHNLENHRRHIASCNGVGTQKMQKSEPVECRKCGYIFKNPENYRRHIERCNGNGTIESCRPGKQICEYCNKEFSNAANYRKHVVHCRGITNIDIQKEYDSGLSIRQICSKYNIGYKPISNIITNKRSSYNSTAIIKNKEPEKFFFGGQAKQSKGEQKFKHMLQSSSILNLWNIVEQYHLFKYRMDFAIIDLKIDIEIDGMQHYIKQAIVDKDIRRDNKLIENGWTIYRIASKDFLARPKVVFKLFEEFVDNFIARRIDIIPQRIIYSDQVIDGDKQWADEREQKILNSDIDFSKKNWAKYLGYLLGIHQESARRWVQNNMPKFYKEKCRTPKKDHQDRCS